MKENDIRRTIAATSAQLDQVVVRDGRRANPLVAATLVLGAGLMAATCSCSKAVYGVDCTGDDCLPHGGQGGTAGTGGQGGLGGGGGAGAQGGSDGGGGAGHGGDAPGGGGSGGT